MALKVCKLLESLARNCRWCLFRDMWHASLILDIGGWLFFSKNLDDKKNRRRAFQSNTINLLFCINGRLLFHSRSFFKIIVLKYAFQQPRYPFSLLSPLSVNWFYLLEHVPSNLWYYRLRRWTSSSRKSPLSSRNSEGSFSSILQIAHRDLEPWIDLIGEKEKDGKNVYF